MSGKTYSLAKLCLALATISIGTLSSSTALTMKDAWINEIHYDNVSTDSGEFIEIVLAPGVSISGFTIERYNGGTKGPYNSAIQHTDLTAGSSVNGYTFYSITLPTNGLQNGSPDGLALINNGTVFQFISYEGVFTALSGSAVGMLSQDIGVSESNSTPTGYSLQLTGSGKSYADFNWEKASPSTKGYLNGGQRFGVVDSGSTFGLLGLSLLGIYTMRRRKNRK